MGQKLVSYWEKRTLAEKVLTISGVIISIAVIVLAIMQMIGLWKNAFLVSEPLLGVLMVINALNIYKYNKRVAFFNLGIAVFIFIIAIITFFIFPYS